MTKEQEIKFNKGQILASKQFAVIEKDILKAILEDKQYSLEEVRNVLEEFNEKEVK